MAPLTKDDVVKILEDNGIEYQMVTHKAVFTIDEMLECELPYENKIAKNLFIRDDKKRNYYLITCLEDKKLSLKDFRAQHGTRQLSFASEEDLMAKLGLYRGAVTPFGILNNSEADVVIFLDRDYEGDIMGVHPCDNTATVFVKTEDVVRLLEANGNEVRFVDL